MIQFSCCIPGGSLMPEGVASVPDSPAEQIVLKCRYLLECGYDCTECAGGMLTGLKEDEIAYLVEENKKSSLKLIAVNSLFPWQWRLADPASDRDEYVAHIVKLFDIMQALGVKYAVFGSGGARSIRSEVGEEKSRETLYDFLRIMAAEAVKRNLTIVIEPLRKAETNVFVTVPETAAIVRELNEPGIRLLYDVFHMAEEGTSLDCIVPNLDLALHCHIAESPNRSYPGSPDSKDLEYNKTFAKELIRGGYNGAVSVECGFKDFKADAKTALAYLREIFA